MIKDAASERALWLQWQIKRTRHIQRCRKIVMRYLRSVRSRSAAALGQGKTPNAAALAGSDTAMISDMILQIWVSVGAEFGRTSRRNILALQRSQVQKTKTFEDDWTERVGRLINSVFVQKITGIDDTTVTAIRTYIEQAIVQGLSVQDIATTLTSRGYIPNLSEARALRIARTEVIGASNAGSLFGAQSTGISTLKKTWLASLDGRQRDTHAAAHVRYNQSPISLDQYFSVGDSLLQYPGDPSGQAEDVINCFSGDTLVSTNGAIRSIMSVYTGKMITIKTTNGHKITVTPNHPILTDRGFIRADAIDYGTNLVCCDIDKSIHTTFDVDDIPIKFEQLHNAFSVQGMVMRMTGVNVNLYGRIPDGDVNIVDIDRHLLNTFKATLSSSVDGRLGVTSNGADFFHGQSRFVHLDNPVDINTHFVEDKKVYTLETSIGIYNANGIISSNCRCAIAYRTRYSDIGRNVPIPFDDEEDLF